MEVGGRRKRKRESSRALGLVMQAERFFPPHPSTFLDLPHLIDSLDNNWMAPGTGCFIWRIFSQPSTLSEKRNYYRAWWLSREEKQLKNNYCAVVPSLPAAYLSSFGEEVAGKNTVAAPVRVSHWSLLVGQQDQGGRGRDIVLYFSA